jgi:hypothetical protein
MDSVPDTLQATSCELEVNFKFISPHRNTVKVEGGDNFEEVDLTMTRGGLRGRSLNMRPQFLILSKSNKRTPVT